MKIQLRIPPKATGKKVDVAVQATENLVPASTEVAVQASLGENPQFENSVPDNHVGQSAPPSSHISQPYPQNNPYLLQEQPYHDFEPAVCNADAHQIGHGCLSHPHNPYTHKTGDI